MLFNSIHFVFFFLVVTTLYFILPYKQRWLLLLISSCYFYMCFIPVYILILGFTIVIDYFAGIYLEKYTGKKRKVFLIFSLIANIGVLAVFKYYNFLNENISDILKWVGTENPIPHLNIILPIGLSFHTFQAMSYTIEVYRGNQKAERHFGIYAVYVMFYPQLVAGPIERPQNLIHQFKENYKFDYDRITDGLKLMVWGFFKKLVVADRLAIYVDAVYNNADQHSGYSFILATIFFAFQIYCDFSGYSDIAIGAAKVMGFKLMTNFNRPYFSKSIAEFWKRWHISLSTWFRDYLYISLGGNRVSIPRWYFNLFFVFLVSGFWHGANWTFIIWGMLNGFYLIIEIVISKLWNKIPFKIKLPELVITPLKIFTTFCLACFAWIFFRANSIGDAFMIIEKIFAPSGKLFYDSPAVILYSLLSIVLLLIAESKMEFFNTKVAFLHNKKWAIRYATYTILVILILLIGVFDGGQFIYFQF